ncbi:hypothetical protein [Salinisphaera sp. Q1T1-3]|uniref:STAND family AAA ATPase n=1 Tax=Salinisphaera sp. Q1T1-3 TaxID=2321229 RepID=UPI0011C3C241|nr:hypothetical protein [Salinisphaera sp. Q1T1-3]
MTEKKNFELRTDFRESLEDVEFCSQSEQTLQLTDLFVFPKLVLEDEEPANEKLIGNTEQLHDYKRLLIVGDDRSGKTTILRQVFLSSIENSNAALLINLNEIKAKKPSLEIFKRCYKEQFTGSFDHWFETPNKTVCFDDLSEDGRSLDHIEFAEDFFDHIFVTVESDRHVSFFRDDVRLVDYQRCYISPFTHTKQEKLIRNWVNNRGDISDASLFHEVDRLERNVNSVILDDKILPRFPFFILSILQTYEAFMPNDLKITAYGHCYYVLIIARLAKAGVDPKDEEIRSCFNFCTLLAKSIYDIDENGGNISRSDFQEFVDNYREKFIITDAVLNRLVSDRGLIKESGHNSFGFSLPYSYYFFLGRSLAFHYKKNPSVISSMVESSHLRKNALALIFAVHHAEDIGIIDDVIIHTMCAIDHVRPAKLDAQETKVFQSLIKEIPERLGGSKSVQENRAKDREHRDRNEKSGATQNEDFDEDTENPVIEIYKTHKNIEILSQIIKNKYGDIPRDKVKEIAEAICNSGLRLISLLLHNESQLDELIDYLDAKFREESDVKYADLTQKDLDHIRKLASYLIFFWTMSHVEKIVSSLAKPELHEVIQEMKEDSNTPALDIIHYFHSLDTSVKFNNRQLALLKDLVKKYSRPDLIFVKKVLSIRTQHHMNTHSLTGPQTQAIRAALALDRKPFDKMR